MSAALFNNLGAYSARVLLGEMPGGIIKLWQKPDGANGRVAIAVYRHLRG